MLGTAHRLQALLNGVRDERRVGINTKDSVMLRRAFDLAMTMVPTSGHVTGSRAGHDGPPQRRASAPGQRRKAAPHNSRATREGETYEEL